MDLYCRCTSVCSLFVLCLMWLIFTLFIMDEKQFMLPLILMVLSIVVQGIGHKKEQNPPGKFTGSVNAVVRIFLEQTITFPKFVLSGGWFAAIQKNKS